MHPDREIVFPVAPANRVVGSNRFQQPARTPGVQMPSQIRRLGTCSRRDAVQQAALNLAAPEMEPGQAAQVRRQLQIPTRLRTFRPPVGKREDVGQGNAAQIAELVAETIGR